MGCIGRYGGLAMFWHDQTKVGNYDAAIRIPEHLYDILAERQRKTLDRFTAQHGRRPAGEERAGLALFFSRHRNPDGKTSLSYMWFNWSFRLWLGELNIGHYFAHQARHTLATNLLRQGATVTHIRRYLGQVSERMASIMSICRIRIWRTCCSTSGSLGRAPPALVRCWPANPRPRSPGSRLRP